MKFEVATKFRGHARVALVGPSGAGKTFTALALATEFGGPIAVIDTERGSAAKYARGEGFASYLTAQPDRHDPREFPAMLRAAATHCSGGTLIIDSLTSWWSGPGGLQELVDRLAGGGNSFQAWGKVRPYERAMYDALLSFPGHVIVTMRSKTEYVIEEDSRGKKVPRKVGLAPEQRQGIEYEFDIVGELDDENVLRISKSRCRSVRERGMFVRPGAELAQMIVAWLDDGDTPAVRGGLLARIDAAKSEDELAAIADGLKGIDEASRPAAREAWGRKRAQLREANRGAA